jgi:hypothetical protein
MNGPEWPAILKLEGVDELVYLADEAQWREEQAALGAAADDRLVDSRGRVFHGHDAPPLETLPMTTFNQLVRAHLVAMQQCCVYKIELESYREGIRMVGETQESKPT